MRHAEPAVDPTIGPARWPLSERGRKAAVQLQARLPGRGVWVSSTEVKAHETLLCAAPVGVVVARDSGFDEVRRREPFDDDHRSRRLAWVRGELGEAHRGWEAPEEAAARFEAAVTRHSAAESPLVVASHGMVITAWLVHGRRILRPERAGDFWSRLGFPDVIEVD